MIELEFLGRSGDGAALVFTDAEGTRYRVESSEELRAEAGRALLVGAPQQPPARAVGPGQLQALLRQGLSAAEVAEQTGTDLERVLRYYAPVAAEIERAISVAMASRIGPEVDSPLMGELVVDRLGARGVDVDDIEWTAAREPGGDWVATLTFAEGDVQQRARWLSPTGSGRVEALDPVAAALTETVEIPSPIRSLFPPARVVRSHAAADQPARGETKAAPPPVAERKEPAGEQPAPASGAEAPAAEPSSTARTEVIRASEALVDQLNAARGKRVPILDNVIDVGLEEDEDDPGEAPAAGPRLAALPGLEDPLEPLVELAQTGPQTGAQPRVGEPPTDTASHPTAKRGKRRPVPSWDEIVFGSKLE